MKKLQESYSFIDSGKGFSNERIRTGKAQSNLANGEILENMKVDNFRLTRRQLSVVNQTLVFVACRLFEPVPSEETMSFHSHHSTPALTPPCLVST